MAAVHSYSSWLRLLPSIYRVRCRTLFSGQSCAVASAAVSSPRASFHTSAALGCTSARNALRGTPVLLRPSAPLPQSASPREHEADAASCAASGTISGVSQLTPSQKETHSQRHRQHRAAGPSGRRTRNDGGQTGAPYKFPVGRALRYIREGQQLRLETEGQEELTEWLASHGHGEERAKEDELERDSAEASPSCGERSAVEVSKFVKYHAHHVLISFKALRKRLPLSHKRRAADTGETDLPDMTPREPCDRTHLRNTTNYHNKSSRATIVEQVVTDASSLLSCADTEALTALLFAAAVLLHVSGLHGVADAHVEPLLDVCFSASIFLAQDAATSARLCGEAASQRQVAWRRRHDDGSSNTRNSTAAGQSPVSSRDTAAPHTPFSDESVVLSESKEVSAATPHGTPTKPAVNQRPALCSHATPQSLHWATVHFAAAVQQWGLLEHTSPLQDLAKTRRPYERLLQAHAALLCELTRDCVDPAVWQELLLLKAGQHAPESRAAWFLAASADVYETTFRYSGRGSSGDGGVPARLQQRRLQLLPLFWLSLLSTHLTHRDETAATGATGMLSSERAGALTAPHGVSWGSARHAFTSLLPLFEREAPLEVTAWAVLHALFSSSSSRQRDSRDCPSLAESCALVAQLERSGATRELASVLASGEGVVNSSPSLSRSGAHAVGAAAALTPTQEDRVPLLLHQLMRRLAVESGVAASFSPLRQEVSMGRVSSMRGTHKDFSGAVRTQPVSSSFSALVATPPTALHGALQLCRALRDVPLSSLSLTLAELAGPAAAPGPRWQSAWSITADGVRLSNALLLRILVQWRSDAAGNAESKEREDGRRSARTAQSYGQDAAAAPAAGEGRDTRVVAAALVRWRRDIFEVLQALHHLRRLLRHAAAAVEAQPDVHARSLCESLLMPTVQMAARAVAEQLGSALLPRRAALVTDTHQPLSGTERRLLDLVDVELRGILSSRTREVVGGLQGSGEHSDDDDSDDYAKTCIGVMPWRYSAALASLRNS